jgi:hypothetical protein
MITVAAMQRLTPGICSSFAACAAEPLDAACADRLRATNAVKSDSLKIVMVKGSSS